MADAVILHMKKLHIAILTVTMLAAGLVGCNKYDEGPAISFRSAASRVENEWEPKVILEDGDDVSFYFQDFSMNLTEDGRFVITDKDDLDSTFTQEGFWSLENDRENLQFIYTNPPVNPDRVTFTIQKLKEKEMWLLEDRDGVIWDWRFVTKGTSEEE